MAQKKYVRDYRELEAYAIGLGYKVNKSKEEHSGWSFDGKFNGVRTVVWKVPYKWIVANVIDEYHCNHKRFDMDGWFSNVEVLKQALDYGKSMNDKIEVEDKE